MRLARKIRNWRLVGVATLVWVKDMKLLMIGIAEREVKRANRDLQQQMQKMDNMQKIDYLTRRSSDLLAEMRRLEKENQKNRRRSDHLQKERDNGRGELSKTMGLKEKLEKLCRELQKDNNKMKVRISWFLSIGLKANIRGLGRMRSRKVKRALREVRQLGTRNTRRYYPNWRGIRKRRIRQEDKWSIWKSMNCESIRLLPEHVFSDCIDFAFASNPSLSSTSCENSTFTHSCAQRNSRSSTTWHGTSGRRRAPNQKLLGQGIFNLRSKPLLRRKLSCATN